MQHKKIKILPRYRITDLKCSNTLTLRANKVMKKLYMDPINVFILLHYSSIKEFLHLFANLMTLIFWTYDRLD